MGCRIRNCVVKKEALKNCKILILMNNITGLRIIRLIHTIIWLFFNVVIFYLLYAVIANKIDKWLWVGLGLFLVEGIVLLI